MTTDLVFVLAVLAAAVALFVTEALPVDLVALLILVALVLSGVITPEEGFAGFANPATVTVAAMFVLSAGIYQTGTLNVLGTRLTRLGSRSRPRATAAIMVGIGVISAFINNTAAVAIFMPIVIAAARESGVGASRMLMPLSFAAMFGGTLTLIGTSTNILVNRIALEHGLAPFGMFEFSRLGLLFFGAGTAYMLMVGMHLIPERRPPGSLAENFRMDPYLADLVLLPESASVGKPLRETPLGLDIELDVLEVRRGDAMYTPDSDLVLQAGDSLRIRANVAKLDAIQRRKGVRLKPKGRWTDSDLQLEGSVLVEAVVAPNSELEGHSLLEAGFQRRFGAIALALRTREGLLHERLGRTPLRAGDALLCEVPREHLAHLRADEAFVLVSEVTAPRFRATKAVPAFAILAGVVAAPTIGLLPIAASATAGAVLMILTRCVRLEEAYQAIPAKVIVLLAGVLTLGVAIDRTGGSQLLAGGIVHVVGDWGPVALVAAFYLLASVLTELMSNNATAVLLAPIAIAAAGAMGIDPRPVLVAVTFAASASFMTPVGYQTNTMIFGAGGYRFTDFARVGGPLNLIFWGLATFFIPMLWPF